MPARAHGWQRGGAADGPVDDRLRLDHVQRNRRRGVVAAESGAEILFDFPRPPGLCDGDVVLLDDGRRLAVIATAEPLLAIRAGPHVSLARLAWHVGNRHLAAVIEPDQLLILDDPVIAHMLVGLGATVTPVTAPFQPEGGAYAGGHGRDHHHHHD